MRLETLFTYTEAAVILTALDYSEVDWQEDPAAFIVEGVVEGIERENLTAYWEFDTDTLLTKLKELDKATAYELLDNITRYWYYWGDAGSLTAGLLFTRLINPDTEVPDTEEAM